jgi:hypothetical protein
MADNFAYRRAGILHESSNVGNQREVAADLMEQEILIERVEESLCDFTSLSPLEPFVVGSKAFSDYRVLRRSFQGPPFA